jgi:hypothetical protein
MAVQLAADARDATTIAAAERAGSANLVRGEAIARWYLGARPGFKRAPKRPRQAVSPVRRDLACLG